MWCCACYWCDVAPAQGEEVMMRLWLSFASISFVIWSSFLSLICNVIILWLSYN
jgi:hypothetical protein